jgi:hypothetical protein
MRFTQERVPTWHRALTVRGGGAPETESCWEAAARQHGGQHRQRAQPFWLAALHFSFIHAFIIGSRAKRPQSTKLDGAASCLSARPSPLQLSNSYSAACARRPGGGCRCARPGDTETGPAESCTACCPGRRPPHVAPPLGGPRVRGRSALLCVDRARPKQCQNDSRSIVCLV